MCGLRVNKKRALLPKIFKVPVTTSDLAKAFCCIIANILPTPFGYGLCPLPLLSFVDCCTDSDEPHASVACL